MGLMVVVVRWVGWGGRRGQMRKKWTAQNARDTQQHLRFIAKHLE